MSFRLLVLDDESVVTSVLAQVLTSAGYAVEAVTTAAAAREHLRSRHFHLAIIDCRVPGDDGMAIADLARDRKAAVLLISGEDQAISLLPKSGYRYLTKPFHLHDLLKSVEAALASRPPGTA